ncbi:uncharacterized protein LOC144147290 [Haemaphysalis longicornis]
MSGNSQFTVEEEADLISLVQERRLLWDVKHRHYHRRDLKEVAFSEVAAVFGDRFTVAQLRSRFANLRTQFTREKRKVQMRSGMSADDVYEPRWVHYNRLKFLAAGNPTQQSVSNMHTEQEIQAIDSMPQANDDWDSEDVHTEDRCGEDVSPSPNQAGSSQDYVVVETNRPATPTRPAAKRRHADDERGERQRLLTSAVEALEKAQRPATATDECDTFGVLIAQTLRQIPPGPLRQTGILTVYQAAINYSASIQVELVECESIHST